MFLDDEDEHAVDQGILLDGSNQVDAKRPSISEFFSANL